MLEEPQLMVKMWLSGAICHAFSVHFQGVGLSAQSLLSFEGEKNELSE